MIIGLNLTTTSMGVRLDDGAAALVIDGVQVVAIAEERLTRNKHCGGVARSVRYCLSTAGITLADVDWIVVSVCCDVPPSPEATSALLAREGLEVAPDRILVCPSHHLSHAASSFLASPFEEALVIVADSEGTILGQRSHPDYWRNRLERTTVWLCRSWDGHHTFERLMSHGDQAGEGSIGSAHELRNEIIEELIPIGGAKAVQNGIVMP